MLGPVKWLVGRVKMASNHEMAGYQLLNGSYEMVSWKLRNGQSAAKKRQVGTQQSNGRLGATNYFGSIHYKMVAMK